MTSVAKGLTLPDGGASSRPEHQAESAGAPPESRRADLAAPAPPSPPPGGAAPPGANGDSPGPQPSGDAAPPGAKRSRSKAQFLSREQILDAALECLKDTGYDGATIRKIAERLGCAVGSIYRYFRDKRELLSAVTHRRFEPVAAAVDAGATVHKGFAHYARVASDEPELYCLMFWLHGLGEHSQTGVPPIIGRIIAGYTDQLGDRRTAERLWAHLHGSIMLGRVTEFMTDAQLAGNGCANRMPLETVITQKTPSPPAPATT